MRMVVEDGSEPANVDPILVRLLLRAHVIRARLLQEPSLPLKEIAAEEGVSSSYVTRLLRLAFLAPDIVTADLKRKASSTAHRKPADGRYPPASRLDGTARTPLLLNRIDSPSFTRVSV
jgi:site-specific DNA recombinase